MLIYISLFYATLIYLYSDVTKVIVWYSLLFYL